MSRSPGQLALDVDGIGLVMVVLGTPLGSKEVISEEPITQAKVIIKTIVSGAFNIALQRVEIVARVEIVNPTLVGSLAVQPRTIRQLPCATVAHRFCGNVKTLAIFRKFGRAGEHRSAQHIRIVNRSLFKRVIAQAASTGGLLARQTEDPVAYA